MGQGDSIDTIASESADLWMQGEESLGRNRQDERALRDLIRSAIEKAIKINEGDTKRMDWLEQREALWRNVGGKVVRIVFKNFRKELDDAMRESPVPQVNNTL